jgi:Flp pilus assembly pilin Flp
MLNKLRTRKGQAAVEYAVILVAILIVSIASISLLGNKTGELWALSAVILPGQDPDDNGPIWTGELVETSPIASPADFVTVDLDAILAATATDRIDTNLYGNLYGGGMGSLDALLTGF